MNPFKTAHLKKYKQRWQSGFTMIELIVYIMVSSIAMTGILLMYQQATARSSQAILAKQALQVANSLLEEIELMPFNYCDPADPLVRTATSTAGCLFYTQGLTPRSGAGKSRGNVSKPFENVGDYGGYTMSPPVDIAGNVIAGLSDYTISVSLANVAISPVPAAAMIQITVTVTGPLGTQKLVGYRSRYAPNDMP